MSSVKNNNEPQNHPTDDKVTRQPEANTSRLFVYGLDPYVTAADLELIFSTIGPLTRCFVVVDINKKCKGTGFVHFAQGEDADKAVMTLNGHLVKGKPIGIDYAKKRTRADKQISTEKAAEKAVEKPTEKTHKKIAISTSEKKSEQKTRKSEKFSERLKARTLVIYGLKPEHNEDWIKAQIAEYGRALEISYPHPKKTTAHVHYQTVHSAVMAVKGLPLKLKDQEGVKVRLQGDAYLKQFRLIIRNLPFKCQLSDIQPIFEKFGLLYDISLPPGKAPGTCKGFGFVNYINFNDVEKAIAKGNGQIIQGRPIAIDTTLPKKQFEELKSKGDEEIHENSTLEKPSLPKMGEEKPSKKESGEKSKSLEKKSNRKEGGKRKTST